MKLLIGGCTIVVSFAVGIGLSPAFAAGSHPTAYVKLFGNSTSCAYGRASVNDDSRRAGSKTSNFAGCNTSNSHRNVPAGYLGAYFEVRSNATGKTCGIGTMQYNGSSAWTKERTTPITSQSESNCPLPGMYFAVSQNVRWSDAGDPYYETIVTPKAYKFNVRRA